MALSGSFSAKAGTSGSGLHHTLRVDWEAVQDIYGNCSTVTCRMYLIQDKGYSLVISKVPHNTCTIGGVSQTFTSPAIHNGGGATTLLGTVSRQVAHESDGSKQVDITAVFYIGATLGGTWYPSITASETVTLDTIPRATVPQLSAAALTLGQLLSIKLEPAADFTHELTYRFGSEAGIIAQNAAGTIQWTPPAALAAQIPNSASGTAVITCTTYQGNTQIGQPQHTQLTLLVQEEAVPTVSAQWQDLSGAFDRFGTLVQLVSRLDVDVTAAGAFGSSIRSVTMTLGGRAYTGGTILDSGALALAVTAVDSRGRSGRAVYALEAAAYTPPQLTLSASRCTQEGSSDDTGSFAKVTVSGAVAELAGNTAALRLDYGLETEEIQLSPGSVTHQTVIPADPDSTLTVTATLTDQFLSVQRSMVLSTGYATMDFLRGGRGIAFGTAATKEGFTCAMDMDMAGKRISGLGLPTGNTDAVSLQCLRAHVPGLLTAVIEDGVLVLVQSGDSLTAAVDGTVLVLGY